MVKHLVVVESPAKCKKIASFLGPDYQVLATMGHIRALEETLDAIGLDRDFEPRFRFLSEKSKATSALQTAARSASTIFLAADDDREGEAIAYSVACLLKKDPLTCPRSVFHEITEKAVKHAIQNPRKLDMNRVFAQQARAVLDMMVGFTISPLLWKHVARGLSAGRCQTPALRLVSDRESQIRSHTIETTWGLQGTFQSSSYTFSSSMDDALEDQESAMQYLENVHESSSVTVNSVKQSPWSLSPPKPLITSTLQQEASAFFKSSPKTTMKIAQKLYEDGHITYMRTDHAVMSDEAETEARALVKTLYGEEYVRVDTKANHVPKKQGKAVESQEAHECIRPTHMETQVLPATYTKAEQNIYTLIWKRSIQSVMAPAKGLGCVVKYTLDADEDAFGWSSNWKKTLFDGWKRLGASANLDDEDVTEGEETQQKLWTHVTTLTPGTKLQWKQLNAVPKRSKAPPRFTEATLIRELEHKGIGRPSTFASLVETLFEKQYIETKDTPPQTIRQTTLRIIPSQWPPTVEGKDLQQGGEKQKLCPTSLGDSVLTFCIKEVEHIFAYDFTATMEKRLDRVAKGEEEWKQVCRDTWNSYEKEYKRLMDTSSKPSSSEKVRDFGNGIKAVQSKKGFLLVKEQGTDKKATLFAPFPSSYTIKEITPEQALASFESHRNGSILGTFEEKPIVLKKGPYGMYVQWEDLKLPYTDSDTIESCIQKLSERKETTSKQFHLGGYTFAIGKYGPYMYKTDLKKKEFVSIPPNFNPKLLKESDVAGFYKQCLESKKQKGLKKSEIPT